MSRAVGNIIKKAVRKDTDKLNCLYVSSGVDYEKCLLTLLSDRVNFYPLPTDSQYVPIVGLDFDFILSQSRIHQLPQIKQISRKLHLPIVSIEHGFIPANTQINPEWTANNLISIYSNVTARNSWGDFNARVIPEALLSDERNVLKKKLLVYEPSTERVPEVESLLTVLADYEFGTSQSHVEQATFYLQTTTNYNDFQRILKCLQSGTIVIAKDCPIIREFIIDGVTGFLYNDPSELVKIKDVDIDKFQKRIIKSYDKFFSKAVFKETFLGKLESVNNFYRG